MNNGNRTNESDPSEPSSNINDTFFSSTYQQVWRRITPPGLTEAECAFIEDVASLRPGDGVLDLLCGYGRHALPLARAGYHVTAVDNAAAYVAEIKQKAAGEGLSVEAVEAGVLRVNLSKQYRAVVCMGNSFAFFNRTDAVALLKKVAESLLPGGVFIINSWMIAEIAIKHFKERDWYDMGDYKYLTHYVYQFSPSRIESEHTVVSANGTVETIRGVDYVFTLQELEGMFNEAGLKTAHLFSTPKKRPFKMGDGTVYIVAQKTQT